MIEIVLEFWPLFLFITLVLLAKIFRPQIKGYLGELTIRFILLFLNKKEYKVINNIHVFYNGVMAQIDHLVISRYGIFVIETKNYKGWIFGSENAYKWTQVIYKRKTRFYNPIRQNLGHIKALKVNLNQYPNLSYFPIVVFTRGSKLKVNSSFPVIKYYNLLRTIKQCKDINIPEEIRDDLYETVLRINGQKPILTPKQAVFGKSRQRKTDKCPYCDSVLILRSGKYGKFLGCTGYPKCRYTQQYHGTVSRK